MPMILQASDVQNLDEDKVQVTPKNYGILILPQFITYNLKQLEARK